MQFFCKISRSVCNSTIKPKSLKYYSTTASRDFDDEDLRRLVLDKSINYVKEYGWTQESLARGAKDAGLPHGLITGGPVDLVHHFLIQKRYHANNSLLAWKQDSQATDAAHATLQLMEEHLHIIHPYRISWPAALALLAQPAHASSSLRFMQSLSADFSRIAQLPSEPSLASVLQSLIGNTSLTAIYSSAELYLLTDESENMADTRYFLKHSLETYFATLHSIGSYSYSSGTTESKYTTGHSTE